MTDFTITHRIEAPELSAAINNLADALKNRAVAVPAVTAVITNPVSETPVQAPVVPAAPVSEVNPTVPSQTVPATVASITPTVANTDVQNNALMGVAQTAPVAPVTPVVPTVAAPTPVPAEKAYTFSDITAAGSQLLDAGRMPDLMNLLKGFGVQALTMLKPEQYADVMAGLIKLGAKV